MRAEVNKVRLTVLIALLFSTLCAGVFRTPPILFMAALLSSAPVVGFVIGKLSSRCLKIDRHLPEVGTVGDLISGELILKNTARLPVFFANAKVGEKADAVVSLDNELHIVPTLRNQSQVTWKHQWVLQRRGVHIVSPASGGVLDPLGLSTRLPCQSEPTKITVLPRPIKIDHLGLLGGMGANNQTPRHSTAVADAMDFHGVRAWQPGETIRRAHWKSTARTGQLHVIEWEETPGADLALMLDTQAAPLAGSGGQTTLEDSITVTATIAAHLLETGCRVQLFYYGLAATDEKAPAANEPQGGVHPEVAPTLQLRQLKGTSVESVGTFLRALAEIEPVDSPEATLENLVQNATSQVGRGMGVVLLASSRAEFVPALQRAGGGGTEARAFVFDADSYQNAIPKVVSAKTASTGSALPQARREKSRDIHTIRSADSLGAALESSW